MLQKYINSNQLKVDIKCFSIDINPIDTNDILNNNKYLKIN